MSNISDLNWLVNHARKTQNRRLKEHLEEGNTIGSFLTRTSAEWQLDSLIRDCQLHLPLIEKELEPKPNKLLFWKK